ncbi:tail fiber protein [Flavobacterium sp. ANB]|uniref:tail fiber protein n=1 Tax=unclassified Flavobacterium TaxID=196869 RepID=UPI00188C9A1C|nr:MULTISPECIES: tail fiber protein [unclassified Flavobacterium]MBF4519002.1 tail fiber protein [Flavobacterium sp. ANB]
MKSKLLLMLCFFCATISNYAQSSATQSGIAVQGIARDANNTAIINQTINLTFTLYYLDASSIEQPIYKITKNLTTDAFGVFSDVIDPTSVNNNLFANNIAYLRIEKGSDVISDEKLRHVPYAISANNGVPTGSIMPFIGTVAPEGWALCNGGALPATAKALIALVGNNAPNLQGMFLRGTGTSPVNGQAGPALKGTQDDSFESHNHSASVNDPGHTHGYGDIFYSEGGKGGTVNVTSGIGINGNTDNDNMGLEIRRTTDGSGTGISVSTGNTGGNETRPVNYGVNYIIKL